jgi:histidyl-tRNA synthetase
LTGILDQAGVVREKHDDALTALDKMDKAGPEGVARELRERGIVDESAVKLMRFFERLAGAQNALDLVDLGEAIDARAAYNADVLGRLVEFIGAHEIGATGVDDLRQILQFAKASGVDARIKLDPTLARGLAYYTGAIIEINVAELAGSLGGGGRYDNLVGMFLGKDVPACGFSLGLERILVLMEELKKFDALAKSGQLTLDSADVMVTVRDEDSIPHALTLARELRGSRLRVFFYPEVRKMSKQLFYWSNREIRSVIIVGPDEIQSGQFRVKDKRRGEEVLARDQIAATLREWIDEDAEAFRKQREDFVALLDRQSK